MDDVMAIILGGGRGQRLFPLTQKRSKPAVPMAGKYRLVDVAVSNCINSRVHRIFVLTQFNSESLNKHITQTYKFDVFSRGFVTVLAAEQTEESESWFQGTADAVRRSLRHLHRHEARDVLILSGDQLYRMDFRRMVEHHRAREADVTVGVIQVTREQASGLGIVRLDAQGRIVHFEEKPTADRLSALESELPGGGRGLLASMGIYAFERGVLEAEVTQARGVDFGRHVFPDAVARRHVQGYFYRGYWEDVGTIRSYFEANLALTNPVPPFDFYVESAPIFTEPHFLPPSKIENCGMHESLVAEGCIVLGAHLSKTIVGIRSRIGSQVRLSETLMLGADSYETLDAMKKSLDAGVPPLGIGEGTRIERAIVDKNARIGRDVRILREGRAPFADGPLRNDGSGPQYFIRDGIVIVPKGGVVADGTVI